MSRSPWRSGTCQSGTTRCTALGAAVTAGGSGPVQWARWSCQVTDGPSPIFRHSGAAWGSNSGGIEVGVVRKRLV
jgi:hypothetical protein